MCGLCRQRTRGYYLLGIFDDFMDRDLHHPACIANIFCLEIASCHFVSPLAIGLNINNECDKYTPSSLVAGIFMLTPCL